MKTANENVLKALARVMAQARAGEIEAVAIVACGNDGVPDASFGGEAELMPSVNLGLDMLKAQFVFRSMKAQEGDVAKLRRPVMGHG